MAIIHVQTEPFDLSQARALTDGRSDVGGLAIFVGLVRDFNDGADVETLFLDHYRGMTEAALRDIASVAESRWPLTGSLIIHRVGALGPGDPIVLVAAASAHRDAAFDACRFIMDTLKTDAPFWKREDSKEGSRWVEARASDQAALEKWR